MMESYDIIVIGAGPAGSNAAIKAAALGLRVALLDEQPRAGGQVWRAKSQAILSAPNTPESQAGDMLRDQLRYSRVVPWYETRVWQIERTDQNWDIHVLCDGACNLLQGKALILATGAREYVQPVPGWTTPGVLGLAGATALFKRDLTVPGQRTVVSGTGPLVFFVASEIRRLGGTVAAVATPNTRRDWARALPAMRARPDLLKRGALWIADLMLSGVPIHWQSSVTAVQGDSSVTSVDIQKLNADWSPKGKTKTLRADSLCLGHGLIPAIEAAQLAGAQIHHREKLGGWVPKVMLEGDTAQEGLFICGDGAGIRGAAAAEVHGKITGLSAAAFLGHKTKREIAKLRLPFLKAAKFGSAMTALSIPKAGLHKLTNSKTLVCRCESLTKSDIEREIASGAQSTNAVKSSLRAGMGPCGGKFCQTAVAQLIAAQAGSKISETPPATPRPPLRPVPTAALSGDFDYDDLPIPKPAPL